MSDSPRRVLLVDADAFFVAVARMVDPEGAGKAPLLIVGGDPTGRGVVCSASYEARRFGVRSAMPMARAVRLCPAAMVVPVPRGVCGRKSREIRAVLEEYAPIVEGASIDEWYMDLAGTEGLYADETLATTAQRIRAAVIERTGLSVSIGGGTNKLVAKLAVERAKPKPGTGATGVHIVAPGDELSFMRTLKLGDIPGVGPKLTAHLAEHGLVSVTDLLDRDEAALRRVLREGDVDWLRRRAMGISDSPVSTHEDAKQVSREETFSRDLVEDLDLERELLMLADRVAEDLRGDGLMARRVTVKLRDGDFKTRSASRTLPDAIETGRAVFIVARELLGRLRRTRRVPARLLGIALSSFEDEEAQAEQLALFAAGSADAASSSTAGVTETEGDRAVARALDQVRAKFGRGAIAPGRLSDE